MILDVQIDFLPGRLVLDRGAPRDYRTLERFHYLPVRPATWAGVWVARYHDPNVDVVPRVVALAALSYASAVQRTRHRVFGLESMSFGERLRWVNANLRTISRVIVHPPFRSVGLAHQLIRCALSNTNTRFVEASARMGRAHPMFARAGMTCVNPSHPDEPVYYWFDRDKV